VCGMFAFGQNRVTMLQERTFKNTNDQDTMSLHYSGQPSKSSPIVVWAVPDVIQSP
jgi:hypothetical protein